eukprot:2600873-Amphidinium_carterae.2
MSHNHKDQLQAINAHDAQDEHCRTDFQDQRLVLEKTVAQTPCITTRHKMKTVAQTSKTTVRYKMKTVAQTSKTPARYEMKTVAQTSGNETMSQTVPK